IVRSPRTFVERPPASSTMIPSGARSHGFEVQSSAASIAPSATSMCCQNPPKERLLRAASTRARIFAWSCAFLLGPVPVVNTMALLRLVTFETWSRFPSRYAPSPRYAHQRERRPGALTIAATISPFDSIPISVPNVGMPRENSSVPSIGSMITRTRPDALADFACPPPISSPRTSSGNPLDVLGEEMGGGHAKSASASGRVRMIIDPIDGTEEFSRGIPTFGTLMGIESNGEIVAAMVSAPGLRSRWWAYRGEGAYRDGKRLHVSNVTSLSKAMVFTTGTGPSKNAQDQAKIRALVDAARNSRSFGGFWQHMLVAEGAIEAALDWTSKPWDLAPLGIMVEEAGGRSTNVRGERTIYTGQLISTNGKIHDEVLAILQ